MLRIHGLLLPPYHSSLWQGSSVQIKIYFTCFCSLRSAFCRLQEWHMCRLTEFKHDWPNILFKFSWNLHGRSVAQMMIRWFLRAEARVQSVWDLWKAMFHSSGCFSAYFHVAYYFTNDKNLYLVHLPPSMHCNNNWQRRQRNAFSLLLNLHMDCKFIITFMLWIRIQHTFTLLSYDGKCVDKAHEVLPVISVKPSIPLTTHLFLLTKYVWT